MYKCLYLDFIESGFQMFTGPLAVATQIRGSKTIQNGPIKIGMLAIAFSK